MELKSVNDLDLDIEKLEAECPEGMAISIMPPTREVFQSYRDTVMPSLTGL
jgi:hypothetical protein